MTVTTASNRRREAQVMRGTDVDDAQTRFFRTAPFL